jgi:hypothetical protein
LSFRSAAEESVSASSTLPAEAVNQAAIAFCGPTGRRRAGDRSEKATFFRGYTAKFDAFWRLAVEGLRDCG